MFLVHLHSCNYVLQNYFYVMFVVCMMVLLLVETIDNPFANIFVQQWVLLWIVSLFVVALDFLILEL